MLDTLRDFFDPTRSISRFLIGTAAFTLILQAIIDLATGLAPGIGTITLALISIVVAAAMFVIAILRKPPPKEIVLAEEQRPPQQKGLILIASAQQATAPSAVKYHAARLQHVWVIATQETRVIALSLEQRLESDTLRIHQSPAFVVDPDNTANIYDIVKRIITEEAPKYGVLADELIADITGGLKPMTAAMSIACITYQIKMQYMKTIRQEDGTPDPETVAQPILLATFENISTLVAT